MSEKTTLKSLTDRLSSFTKESPREKLALGLVLSLSAFLTLYRLPDEGYGNVYYTAAVKNMLRSWDNFFFVSFDAGFVTVDKPPLGLWIQAASAWVFGFSDWSVLLPQAIACILSVALLYHLVSRTFGSYAGLIAALVMTVTPIVIPTSRNNTTDMLVVLAVLVGTYFVLRAAETGRRRWLFGSMIAVGLGFNIKMMQAYLVLPAFYLVYLLGTDISMRRRITNLILATGVLAVVSFAWATVVELTPSSQRPYIGSTTNDSIFSLIFGYNGIMRLLGMGSGDSGGSGMGNVGAFNHGDPGPLRLFNQQLAGQIGWVLPIALVGLALLVYRQRHLLSLKEWSLDESPLNGRSRAVVLWGTWFLTATAFFSVAGFFHLYYLVMLAPAVAALVGVGLVELWSDYQKPGLQGWLLPATLVGTSAVQAYILLDYPDFSGTLIPVVVGVTLLSAAVLTAGRLRQSGQRTGRVVLASALGIGLLALLVTPTIWGAFAITSGTNVSLPSAGPSTMGIRGGGGTPAGPSAGPPAMGINGSGGAPSGDGAQPPQFDNGSYQPADTDDMSSGMAGFSSGELDSETNSALISYLEANQGDATYLAAVDGGSSTAAPLMLESDEPIISLGGFSGGDPVMDASELKELVESGELRYVVSSQMGGGPMGNSPAGMNDSDDQFPRGNSDDQFPRGTGGQESGTSQWIENNCATVPNDEWQSSDSGDEESAGYTLYDCTTSVSS